MFAIDVNFISIDEGLSSRAIVRKTYSDGYRLDGRCIGQANNPGVLNFLREARKIVNAIVSVDCKTNLNFDLLT
jgi:hypothetical protein